MEYKCENKYTNSEKPIEIGDLIQFLENPSNYSNGHTYYIMAYRKDTEQIDVVLKALETRVYSHKYKYTVNLNFTSSGDARFRLKFIGKASPFQSALFYSGPHTVV